MNYAIILAGGHGERFWPLSTKETPKQLLSLFSDNTMLGDTVERISSLIPRERIYIITNERLKEKIKDKVPEISEENIIVEPKRRNTAPAICMASMHILQEDPEAKTLILPSDHIIEPRERFINSLEFSLNILDEREDSLAIFGIEPTRADTNYGYIQIGDQIESKEDMSCYQVLQFKEKPSRVKAQEFYLDAEHLWNSGMFVWRAETILNKMKEYLPDIYDEFKEYENYIGTSEEKEKIREVYDNIDSISIDFGIMEKAEEVVVIKSTFKWDDVGSWKSLDRVMSRDADNNISKGKNFLMDTYDTTVLNNTEDLMVCVGFSDVLAVKTEDAVLIINKAKLNEMRNLISALKEDDEFKKYL